MANRTKIKILIAALALSLIPASVHASQGPGGYVGACGSSYYRGGKAYSASSTCEHAGSGWAYFKYDNGFTGSLLFGPAGSGTGGVRYIGSDCPNYGGFYHYGYVDTKYTSWSYGDWSVWMNGNASIGNPARLAAMSRWGWGASGTDWLPLNWDYNPDPAYYEDYDLPWSGSHYIYYNGTQYAHLDHFESMSSTFDKYKQWLSVSGDANIWNTYGDGGISYFCYGEGLLSAKYTGSTKAQVNSSDVADGSDTPIYDNTATVRFLHTITRQNEGANQAVSTIWNVNGSNWTHGEAWVSLDKTGAGSQRTVWMDNAETVSLAPGQKRTFDQTLEFYPEATVNGVKGNKTNAGKYTISIHRPISNTINGRTLGRVNGVDVPNGGDPIEITSGNTFTVSFAHQLSRGDDSANGTVDVDYSTHIDAYDSRGQKNFAYGTARSGVYYGLGENSGWKDAVSFSTETISGTLLPDETKTFCQNMTYPYIIDHDGGNKYRTTTTYCVSVHRPKTFCNGKDVSVLSSHNYGRIQARKTNTNGSTAWEDTALVDTGNSTVTVWARPDNKVHFKEEMCESAELSNQYFNLRKGITYTIDATSNTYMQNLTPSSWNNSAINGPAYEGTDIFGGTTYRKTTESPASSSQSTNYNITNTHLGTSFYQRLTWTDLWTNKGSVVPGHTGNSNATATATVYIPYNYRNKPETSSGNNPYVMPGTQTYTITPTITVEERKNTPVNGDTPYATPTKQTKYQVISYRIGSGASSSSVYTKNDGYYSARANGDADLSRVCTEFLNGGATNCRKEGEGSGVYNPGTTTLNPENIDVDEVIPIGTKICTVVAVWPSDSHSITGDITNASQESNALNASENTNARMWRVSQPTCSTVAKKPNFHSYNSGVYAEDEINTAVSNRTHRTSGGAELNRSYGSWSEFDVTSGAGNTLGLSSGARLWGGIVTQDNSNKYCYVSGLTFTNNQCSGSGETRHVGKKGVNKLLASDPENIYNQIMTRYTMIDAENPGIGAVNTTTNLKIEGACEYNERTGVYTPKAKEPGVTPSFSCLANGAYYTKVKGNAATANGSQTVITGYDWWGRPRYGTYISEMWTSTDGEHSSNTYVTHVKGTLYINQNFHYGDIERHENTPYTSISEVPQTIFIAKDIKISSDVDHIDAWLIAQNSIDTCYPADGQPVSVDNCNSQLTVTGPVITKKLYLNRTYGGGRTSIINNSNFDAWVTEDSEGAEIFKMSPFTYLWSYSQSQRYSQAITTYSKELPTRF